MMIERLPMFTVRELATIIAALVRSTPYDNALKSGYKYDLIQKVIVYLGRHPDLS